MEIYLRRGRNCTCGELTKMSVIVPQRYRVILDELRQSWLGMVVARRRGTLTWWGHEYGGHTTAFALTPNRPDASIGVVDVELCRRLHISASRTRSTK